MLGKSLLKFEMTISQIKNQDNSSNSPCARLVSQYQTWFEMYGIYYWVLIRETIHFLQGILTEFQYQQNWWLQELNITWVNNSWLENEMLFTVLWWSKLCPSQATSEAHMHVYICAHTHTLPKKRPALAHYSNTKVIDCKIEPYFWLCCEWIFHGVSATLNEMLFSAMWLRGSCSVPGLQCCNRTEVLWDPTQILRVPETFTIILVGASGQHYYRAMKFHIWKYERLLLLSLCL